MKGSCHCGKVAYHADIAPTEAYVCNCSLCRRKGYMLAPVPGEAFILDRGAGETTIYKFNKHRIEHHTCATCGCAPFSRGPIGAEEGQDGKPMVMANLRCAEDIDLATVKLIEFDGANKL